MATCTHPDCDRPMDSRGLCKQHAYRLRRYGSPDGTWETCAEDGCSTHPRRGHLRCSVHERPRGLVRVGRPLSDVVGNRAAHNRVERARGKASEHECEDCHEPAEEWAYDHTDPAPLRDATGRRSGQDYSLDVSRYRPLCRSCHRVFDRRQLPIAPTYRDASS